MREKLQKIFGKSEHWKIIAMYLLIFDIFAVNASYFFGLWLRFDLRYSMIPEEYLHAFICFAPFYTVFCIGVFYVLHLYNSLWRFASFNELNRILGATIVTTLFQVLGITALVRRMPLSYYIIGAVLQFMLVASVRFLYRYITLERAKKAKEIFVCEQKWWRRDLACTKS